MYKDSYVVKPWGWEYLMYENKDVALWFLHIDPNEGTSMHCHSHKTTGLVLLEGDALLKFLSDSEMVHAPAKRMIRRGLFHSTEALYTGAILLEIETPNDKTDLIRLGDGYGRQNAGYETNVLPKTEGMMWIDKGGRIFGDYIQPTYELSVHKMPVIENNSLEDADIYMVLQGRAYKEVDGVKRDMLIAGDVGFGNIMNLVLWEATGCSPDTMLLRVHHERE